MALAISGRCFQFAFHADSRAPALVRPPRNGQDERGDCQDLRERRCERVSASVAAASHPPAAKMFVAA